MSRVAVVTGVAGGIGTAVAARLQLDGYRVLGTDVCSTALSSPTLQIDLAVPGSAATVVDCARSLGQVATIVHCAAQQTLGAAGTTARAVWQEMMAINVLALDELVGCSHDDLVASRGSVVAVSSVHSVATTPGIAPYATSKAALGGWVRAAALDYGPHGVRVNAVLPGAVDTPMLRQGLSRRPQDGPPDSAIATLARRTPLQTVGQPAQMAELVAFLVDGDRSGFITGSSIVADGAATIHLSTEHTAD